MVRRRLALSFLVLCSLGCAGCGGSEDDGSDDDRGEGLVPPKAPEGPPSTGGERTVLAIQKLFLGDTDRAGVPSNEAWKDIGYNLDGYISTPSSTRHCTPALNANPAIPKTDGTQGIDNSFGLNLVPLIEPLAPMLGSDFNQALANGDFTVLFDIELGSEQTATQIPAKLHAGGAFDGLVDCAATPTDPNCSPPKFDGTDVWPLSPEGDTTAPIEISFPNSFIVDGTWVSGDKGALDMVMLFGGVEFTMHIASAVITMKVAGRGADASASEGVIAGVVKTEDFIGELQRVAGSIDASLCDAMTFKQVSDIIRRASDIMSDGTNGDPARTCDALSVGLGFEAKPVQLGEVVVRPAPPPDPCAAAQ